MALRTLTALALVAALLGAPSRASAQRGLEYEVKAAYLYNIVNFVTWPPDAFDSADDPVRICVFGRDPFGALLDNALRGGVADKRPIVPERVASIDGAVRCHLIFLPAGSTDRLDQILKGTTQRPVLIVGETPDFLRRGGMIAFAVDGGRVRFDINQSAASSHGLALSSRLLQVARNIVGRDQP